MLTPYHLKVWTIIDQAVVKAMEIIEYKVNELAKSIKIDVVGPYNPINIGCSEDIFFDDQHPKPSCLIKLERMTKIY